eukprot:240805-Alexandrium_andersonii.AAC.1
MLPQTYTQTSPGCAPVSMSYEGGARRMPCARTRLDGRAPKGPACTAQHVCKGTSRKGVAAHS